MTQKFYNNEFVKFAVTNIARQLYMSEFKPTYIVGLTRGGLTPGVMLSHYIDVPFFAINKDESNLWMADDAYSFISEEFKYRKNILIVDDINDTGNTFNALKKDWMTNCIPDDSAWNDIWHKNVRFAALIDNTASPFRVDYWGHEINKEMNPEWCVFPWEQWW